MQRSEITIQSSDEAVFWFSGEAREISVVLSELRIEIKNIDSLQ